MVNAAEMLLREIPTDTTLCELINTINKKSNNKIEDKKNIICNFDSLNIIHVNALQGKEARDIVVNKDNRRVDLKYTRDENNWISVKLQSEAIDRNIKIIHIPKAKEMILGINNEIGVNTINGLYLTYENAITQYILKKIEQFDYENNKSDQMLITILFNYIFNESALEIVANDEDDKDDKDDNYKYILDNIVERNTSIRHGSERLWAKIDKDELMRLILKDKYSIYTTRYIRGLNGL